MAGNDEKLTFSVREAAARLGISLASAYKAVRLGQLPSIRIGGRLLVPRSGLNELLHAGEAGRGRSGALP